MYKLYEVDPDADTLLIVPAPSTAFAKWDDGASQKSAQLANGTQFNGVNGHGNDAANGITDVNAANRLAKGVSELSLDGNSLPEMRIKVSSKHLSLASRHFSSRFQHGQTAPRRLPIRSDGRMHVRLEDGVVDPSAAVVVMNVIHGRGRKVPRFLGLDALAKVALFVDRYRFHDAVEVYADLWVSLLLQARLEEGSSGGDGLPDVYCRDLVLWIYVAYVFRQHELFRRATAVAISKSSGPISSLGLPIRERIIRSINTQRQELILQAATLIHNALGPENSSKGPPFPQPVCTIGCDSFLRSAFAQSLARSCGVTAGSSAEGPTAAAGVDFAAVAAAAREVEQTHERWHANAGPVFAAALACSSRPRKRKSPNANPAAASPVADEQQQRAQPDDCVSRMQLTPALREMEAQIGGLELESSLGYYLY